jgi:hypothetical protein
VSRHDRGPGLVFSLGQGDAFVQTSSIVTCAAVVRRGVLLAGGNDCSIAMYRLSEHNRRELGSRIDCFYRRRVSYGLRKMMDSKFINIVKLPMWDPRMRRLVFKSGTVAIAAARVLAFCDARGIEIDRVEKADELVDIDQYHE